MNENQTTTVEKGLDDKRKNAMLRYIGIMFIVAFVFVLVSMLGELRSSEATISALNQSSTSAITKAEQLQDHNRQLETDNAYLSGRIEELEKQLEDLELELSVSEETVHDQQKLLEENQKLTEQQRELSQQVHQAYEKLLLAMKDPSVIPELEDDKQYFDTYAYELYENLIKKGVE